MSDEIFSYINIANAIRNQGRHVVTGTYAMPERDNAPQPRVDLDNWLREQRVQAERARELYNEEYAITNSTSTTGSAILHAQEMSYEAWTNRRGAPIATRPAEDPMNRIYKKIAEYVEITHQIEGDKIRDVIVHRKTRSNGYIARIEYAFSVKHIEMSTEFVEDNILI